MSNSVATALLFPVVIGILLLGLQWGLNTWAAAVARGAAEDAARAIAVLDGSEADAMAAARRATNESVLNQAQVRVDASGAIVEVTVTGSAPHVLPLSSNQVSVTAQASRERMTRR